jgi:hypothetical protein
MPETRFDEWIAARYEVLWPELFDPALIAATVGFLAGLAPGGSALEFGARPCHHTRSMRRPATTSATIRRAS